MAEVAKFFRHFRHFCHFRHCQIQNASQSRWWNVFHCFTIVANSPFSPLSVPFTISPLVKIPLKIAGKIGNDTSPHLINLIDFPRKRFLISVQ
jgi:hypothetical protein